MQSGQQFIDTGIISRMPQQLPEQLRPRLGRLTPAQMRVYEDFARLPQAPRPCWRRRRRKCSSRGQGACPALCACIDLPSDGS